MECRRLKVSIYKFICIPYMHNIRISVTNHHQYVPFVLSAILSFPHSRVARREPLLK